MEVSLRGSLVEFTFPAVIREISYAHQAGAVAAKVEIDIVHIRKAWRKTNHRGDEE